MSPRLFCAICAEVNFNWLWLDSIRRQMGRL